MSNIRIGEVLEERGYVTAEQVEQALEYQKEHRDKKVGEVLVALGFVNETQMLGALADRLNVKTIDIEQCNINVEAVAKIPKQLAIRYNILAYAMKGNNLFVVVNDPLNFYALEDIRQLTGMHLDIALTELAPLQKSLEYCYAEVSAKQAANRANTSISEQEEELELVSATDEESDSEVPIIRLLNSLIMRAYNTNASDIHIEPYEKETIVRMRIDGTIVEYVKLKHSLHAPLIARIKIVSNMDIAEKRIPQDGHFKMKVEQDDINMRISVIPTVFGEKAVIRLLSNRTVVDQPETFGMTPEHYRTFLPLLKSPNGILYLTGPTGSGKTTMLYMILEYLSKGKVNISTIEDPVEKNIAKINQMQVNPVSGLTFDVGLRALLRQDPDIIMVGETRDAETASISVRAAITGHLVLSTLHTNNAVSSIVRLVDMGLEPYLIANSLVGVVAQRLMRKVCPECGRLIETTVEEREILGQDVTQIVEAVGCPKCNQTGYQGRVAIHEIAVIDKTIRRMISQEETMEHIQNYAVQEQGMETLRESAIKLVREGVTTMEELWKVAYYS
ncbi:MAG: ATPase, T2SS/T4P/T4SS family [Lachnospiraceae bacterium]